MTESSASPDAPERRRLPLHTRILVGLMIGSMLGLTVNMLASREVSPESTGLLDTVSRFFAQHRDTIALQIADPLGKVFLRLIYMIVIPLIVSALTLGILEVGDASRLGRIGLRTLGFTVLFSLIAVAIGIASVNLLKPGNSLPPEQQTKLKEQYQHKAQTALNTAGQAKSISQTLLDMIPENPLQEMVGAMDASSKGNGILAVMFFALVLGAAIAVAGPRAQTLIQVIEGVFDTCMVIIGWAMRLAPYGVACLLFAITSRLGIDILMTLGYFVLVAIGAMSVQMFVVYPLALILFARRSPRQFFRDISVAMVTAFGTSSSNATLPTALRVAEEKLRLPPEISRFVLTIGATGNQNGTALYEGLVVLFLAQVFGVELSLQQQLLVVLMSVIAGIGTAGVPGGSIPMIVGVLQSIKVPGESIAIILGVDRLLDMCRTVLNVGGDLVLATCVASGEKAEAGQLESVLNEQPLPGGPVDA